MSKEQFKPADKRGGDLVTLCLKTASGKTKEYKAINHFKPNVDLTAETVTCEYVERPFMTEKERASMIAEAANDLDGVRDYLNEWFYSRVADRAGELPPSLEETMTALASINHVLDSFTNAGNLRTASDGRNGAKYATRLCASSAPGWEYPTIGNAR